MNEISIQFFKSKYGELIVGSFEEQLCLCDWRYRKLRSRIDQNILKGLDAKFIERETSTNNLAIDQLNEYFDSRRKAFDIPLLMVGTVFQKSVWEELLKVPFGKTETYLGLSRKMGDENAIRAVANANGANAISIMVPCHRIIGSKGEMVGYAGGLPVKKKLLELESGRKFPEQMDLFN